jgi:tetratricopeptide (TPR) repeat protein/DNA-binding SARP family transcriptional activator
VDTNFGILGTTTLLLGGEHVENWGPPRARAVLATLLANAGRTVPNDMLIEWAWSPDEPRPLDQAATSYTYATKIRRPMDGMAVPPRLRSGHGGYRLDVDKNSVDYFQFRSLLAEARAHAGQDRPQQTIELVERALHLWRGVPLADCAGERAHAWRTRVVHDEWLPANSLLIAAMLNIAQFDEALSRLDDLQPDFPFDVMLATHRLSALHGLARFAEATAYYLSTRQRYVAEIDEHAAEHLRQHQESLIRQRPDIVTRAPVVQTSPLQIARPAATPTPRQLPHQTLEFVGRQAQLAALDATAAVPTGPGDADAADGDLPTRRGVVIVTGMPGTGKTALVVHWAHRVRHLFSDGDLYVNLNGFSERDMLPTETVVDDFLIAFGQHPDDNLDKRSRQLLLRRLITNRKLLIILDNARSTAHVRDIVALLPNAFVIVTSRLRLSTLKSETNATRVQVDPMDRGEATTLLMTRVTAENGRLSPADADRLALLCGGLPIVIDVAAENLSNRSAEAVSAFIDRLDHRHVLMELGEDGDESIAAYRFFSWSYFALNEHDRRLFRLLALVPGADFSIDVACACDGRTPAETRKSMRALTSAHLIGQCDKDHRFEFHDLLAEFALFRADLDETEETRRSTETRVISFYCTSVVGASQVLYPSNPVAPQLPPVSGVQAVTIDSEADAKRWLDDERPNLLAAVRLATEHAHHDQAWRLADPVAAYLDRSGHHFDARSVQELALRSARESGHRDAEASALGGLGLTCIILGERRDARRYLDLALRLVEQDGIRRGQSAVLHQIARLETLEGDHAAAAETYRRCLAITTEIDDIEGQAWTHLRLGGALRALDQHQQALVELSRAAVLAGHVRDGSALAVSLAEIGSVYRELGNHDLAAANCEQALAIAEATPDLVATAQICTILAEVGVARRQLTAAARYARRAVTLCRQTHNVADEAHALDALGVVEFADGNAHSAVEAWRAAVDLYQRAGNNIRADALRSKISDLPATSPADLPRSRPSGDSTPARLPDQSS